MSREYEDRLRRINEGRTYHVETMGGMCPTQAEGTLPDGRFFYFRARHGWWTLNAARDPEAVYLDGELIAEGEDSTNGCMSDAAVLAILDEHFGGGE